MNPVQLLSHFERISDAPDATQRLRCFILDLAVRGKLVEQDPRDEPASELLKRIREEKAGLVKAGEIKKLEPFEPVEVHEIPFTVPLGWEVIRMGWLARKLGAGSTPLGGKSVYQREGVPFLRSQNVHDAGLRLDDVACIAHSIHERMSGTHVHPNDILLNITGASIGRCALVPSTFIEGNVSQHVAIIRLFLPDIRQFIHLSLTSPFFQKVIDDVQVGVSREGLSMQRLCLFPMLIPPLAEQHRIVAKVDELMALCDRLGAAQTEREGRRDRLVVSSLNRLNNGADADAFRGHACFYFNHLPRLTTKPEHIQQLRQAILNLAVRGKLVPQDPGEEPTSTLLRRMRVEKSENEPFLIPISWAWVSVDQVGDSRLGKMLDKAKNKGTPRRYLRNVNVRWFDFDLSDVFVMPFEDDELEEFALHAGDVLICEGGEPGRAAVWDKREHKIYFQKAIHRVRFSRGVSPHFFVNALRESADSGRLATYFTGVAIKHFTGKGLASFVFPLPPLAEQQSIVAKVDELMALCDKLEAQLTTTHTDSRRFLEAILHKTLAPAVAN